MTVHAMPADEKPVVPRRLPFRLITASEREASVVGHSAHIIKGLLRPGSVAAIQGRPGLGKTALAIRLAACLQNGEEFLGRATKQATVVYFAAEDENDVANRLVAHDLADEVLILQPIDWLAADKPDDVFMFICLAAEEAAKPNPDRPVVIFVDTLRAALGSQSVMEDRIVSPFLNAIRRAAEQTDACVIILHHTNRENTRASKGETLESVVVCELVLTDGSGDWVNLEIGKNRNGPGRRQIGRVKFGSKPVGEEEAAIILELVPDDAVKAPEDDSTRGLGGNQRRVLNIVKSHLCGVKDKIQPFGFEGPEVKAVSEASVIDEFVSATVGDMPSKKREACARALNGLISRGLIAKRDLPQGAMVWLVKE